MVQWANRLRNNILVNPLPLPLLCKISGALHLAQPGLTAGWLADEIQLIFENFKFTIDQKYRLFASFNKGAALLQLYQCI